MCPSPRPIELLAPARNVEIGMEAIRHGADAVYIGADDFGARHQAGNSVDDIQRLCDYAHVFGARVYVTVNTILYDSELKAVEALVHRLYNAGVDALIVQDMALLRLDIPPIDLHASTQMDIRSADKATFLGKVGFSQLVLARELSLDEIAIIHQSTSARLEAFVHGALCVSYSGCCYASQFCFDRSANRGRCAQFCRHSFNLVDANGKEIVHDRYLLSLHDMNRSDSIEDMIRAGVSSFKIEGRLKDMTYVKNLTAYYRNRIDAVIEQHLDEFCRSSVGRASWQFTPNPSRSFNRGFTDYFLHRRTQVGAFSSPKSIGEYVGVVARCERQFFEARLNAELHAGDGLCYVNEQGALQGFRVNRAEGNRVFPASMPDLTVGTKLYRNQDMDFDKQLARPSAIRKIGVSVQLEVADGRASLTLTDETGLFVAIPIAVEVQNATSPQHANMERILGKMGDTPFVATTRLLPSENYFIPSSVLTQARRTACEKLEALRHDHHRRRKRCPEENVDYYKEDLDYTANVSNALSRQFYMDHGVKHITSAFELQEPREATLMECRHCIRYSLGFCSREGKKLPYPEPLYLQTSDSLCYPLEFDCKHCVMRVLKPIKRL